MDTGNEKIKDKEKDLLVKVKLRILTWQEAVRMLDYFITSLGL